MKCTAGELPYVCSKKYDQKKTCKSEREPENSACSAYGKTRGRTILWLLILRVQDKNTWPNRALVA
jgi:hypothetical protein